MAKIGKSIEAGSGLMVRGNRESLFKESLLIAGGFSPPGDDENILQLIMVMVS